MNTERRPARFLYSFIALLLGFAFIVGLWRFREGLALGWHSRGSGDLHERFVEYGYFLFGVYPNPEIAGDRALPGMRHSVYPPYAFPMLALFFGRGSWLQAKVVVALTVALSLPLMGMIGFQRLRPFGRMAGLAGLILPFSLASISAALEWGQFGFFTTSMVLLQMLLLERGRKYSAGLCWALAMLKPQVGLAFFGLFGFRRQWQGCLFGLAVLIGLALFTFAQTHVLPAAVIHHWLFGQDLSFSFGNIAGLPFNASRLSPLLSSKVVVLLALVLAFVLIYRLSLVERLSVARRGLLRMAGVYAVVGRLAFYHRPHDDVMLFPALLACLALALEAKRKSDWLLFSLLLFSLSQPSEWVMNWPRLAAVNSMIWLIAGMRLLQEQFKDSERPEWSESDLSAIGPNEHVPH